MKWLLLLSCLAACKPSAPAPALGVQRVDSAIVLGGRALVDRVIEKPGDFAKERCVIFPDAPPKCHPMKEIGKFRRVGSQAIFLRSEPVKRLRFLSVVSMETGEPSWEVPLGVEVSTEYDADDEVLTHPEGGVIVSTNHGMFGAPVFTRDAGMPAPGPKILKIKGVLDAGTMPGLPMIVGVTSEGNYAVEYWPVPSGTVPAWRAGLPEKIEHLVIHQRWLFARSEHHWSQLELSSGALVAQIESSRALCFDDTHAWTSTEKNVVTIDLQSHQVTKAPLEFPGWVTACMTFEGAPVFHGGFESGQEGWLLGAGFSLLKIGFVDLWVPPTNERSPWLFDQIGAELLSIDPRTRAQTQLGKLYRLIEGPQPLWYDVDTYALSLHTLSGNKALTHRTWPQPEHVEDGVLWSFPDRAPLDAIALQRFRLPSLEPVSVGSPKQGP